MKSGNWLRRAVAIPAVVMLALWGAGVARADDAGNEGGGRAGRAARLSSVEGAVQVAQGGEVLADHALVNTPLFEGSQVSTGEDGRAEIQFDDGSVARIPPDSSLTISVLRPGGETEIVLDSGMGYFEMQDGAENPMRVRFGADVVTASGFTVLRVKLDGQPGELAVFSGDAHLDSTNGVSMDLHGGESVSLNNLNLSRTIEPDSWDAWNSDRDQAQTAAGGETAPASDLPESQNPAWNDLNANGTWYDVPDQGYVWSPYEAMDEGWDPYGVGSWMWTPGYGYMWVSGYPWGYLPYQCGSWNWYGGFGWGWAPGMCHPWWGGGVWVFNIGNMPTRYRLPVRPHPPRPFNPRPVEGGSGRTPIGVRPRPSVPIISVRREEPVRPPRPIALPPRTPDAPVMIGGVVGHPLKPTTPREPGVGRVGPVTGRPQPGTGLGLRPGPVQGGSRQGYGSAPPRGTSRPVYTPPVTGAPRTMPAPVRPGPPVTAPRPGSSGPVYRPPVVAPSRPSAPPPAPRPAPAPAPHAAPPPASHPSGGGGGGHPASNPHR